MDKIFVLHGEFCQLRFMDDNSSVNTTIFSEYSLLSIKDKDFQDILTEIQIDIKKIIAKYNEKHMFEVMT